MHFFLQNDSLGLDKEIADLKYVLSNYGNKWTHYYDEVSTEDIKNATFSSSEINVPVGDLGFVSTFLESVKGSGYMKPLEIPKFLRKSEYLGRYYDIVKFKDLPRMGSYFIKDATHLKSWDARVFCMPSVEEDIPKLSDDWKEHDYVCSEVLDIIYSEYRVLVFNDVVRGVQYYSGFRVSRDCLDVSVRNELVSTCDGVLSFPDAEVIKNIVEDIKEYRKTHLFPKAYTLDIAVTPKGTVLLEVHNFISCGTYGFCDRLLPNMYRAGIEFELER